MADDKSFKELIAEQKRTNKLLMQQMASDEKGSKLGTSIKNSAGEIINDVLIGNKQKRESDETQAIIKKTSDKALEENEKNQKESNKVWSSIANTLTGAFLGKSKGSAAEKEKDKDEKSRAGALLKKYLGKNSYVGKKLLGVFDSFKGFAKSLYGKGKGILKVLLGAAGFGLLLKFLDSPEFKAFIESGDAGKKIGAAAKAIFGKGGFLDKTVKFLTEFLPNILWGKDKGGTITEPDDFSLFGVFSMATKSLRKNIGIAFNKEGDEPLWKRILAIFKIVLITAAPFLAIGAATALGALAPALIWTLSGIGLAAVFSTTGLIVAAALLALVPAFKFMMKRKADQEAKGEKYDTYIGDVFGVIGGGFLNVLNILAAEALDILTLGVFDFGKTARETDYRVLFSDWYTDLGKFLYNTVAGALKFVKNLIMGKDEDTLAEEILTLEKQKNAITTDIREGGSIKEGIPGTTVTVAQQKDRIQKRIDKLKKQKSEGGVKGLLSPSNDLTQNIRNQNLQRLKETGNAADFKTNLKYESMLVKDILGDIGEDDKIKGGSIEDLYYNKEGKLTYTPGSGGIPPVVSTNIDAKTNNSTYLTPKTISNMSMHDVLYGK